MKLLPARVVCKLSKDFAAFELSCKEVVRFTKRPSIAKFVVGQ
jgi:hypothetical protein